LRGINVFRSCGGKRTHERRGSRTSEKKLGKKEPERKERMDGDERKKKGRRRKFGKGDSFGVEFGGVAGLFVSWAVASVKYGNYGEYKGRVTYIQYHFRTGIYVFSITASAVTIADICIHDMLASK